MVGEKERRMADIVQASADDELQAIEAVLRALEPLEPPARNRVLGYVFNRLGLTTPTEVLGGPAAGSAGAGSAQAAVVPSGSPTQFTDIRTLADTKKPSTVQERVALTAFYLSELAPSAERKEEFSAKDLTRYLKQANLPIPARPRQALLDAKNAGYLDSGSARGTYRLNPVGYNLVAHRLPAARKAID
jgi:hypothetical protein